MSKTSNNNVIYVFFTVHRVVPPNITLYPVWEGDSPVKLICFLSGFFPNNVTVKWQEGNQPLKNVTKQTMLENRPGKNNVYSLKSEIDLDRTGWKSGSTIQCKANHENNEYIQTINVCQSEYICFKALHEHCFYIDYL